MQFFYLLFIGITNIFYNLWLLLLECYQLAGHRWWWQLRLGMFLAYLAESPFSLVKREGKRAPVHIENLTYGETPGLTILKILQEVSPTTKDHFVDLGCGRGLTTFFVRLALGIPATGVDLIPSFIKKAEKLAQQLKIDKINFIRENLAWLTLDQVGQGTIFYLTSTTFEDELLAKIALRLDLLPQGIKLITLSDALPSNKFQVTKVQRYHFSWGQTDVYFHEKVA